MQWQTHSNYANAPNQRAKFNGLIRLGWLIALLFLFTVGCAQTPQMPTISTSLVIPTPTNQVTESRNEALIEPTITPFALPSPTLIPIDLYLGDVDRGMNCPFITEVAVLVLEQELNLNISVTHFDNADNLFHALTEQQVDLTLCYIDPDDRNKMKDKLGHIRQIGSTYWSDRQGKLQIWANGASKAHLRDEMPCVLYFFEHLNLTNMTSDMPAQQWVQNHADQVQNWINCVPSN